MKCPLCSKSTGVLIEDYENYSVYHCLFCGVDFSNPMKPAPVEFYTEQEVYDVNFFLVSADLLTFGHKQFFYDMPAGYTDLLDIGCGVGTFLNKANEAGYKGVGIDFNPNLINFGKEYFNLENIYNISIEKFLIKEPLYKFKVITFFEVLEHLSDPKNFILQIKKFLVQDGYIALSVPNRKRTFNPPIFEKHDSQPNHLTWWDKNSLEFFLNTNGFIITRITDELDENSLITILNEKVRLGIIRKGLQNLNSTDLNNKEIENLRNLSAIKQLVLTVISKIAALFFKLFKAKGLWIYVLARLIK